MPWHPIGRGRLAASALPLAPCDAFWQSALTALQSAQHPTAASVPESLLSYPNCALYAHHSQTDPLLAAFLFATPFADVARDQRLLLHAVQCARKLETASRWRELPDQLADHKHFAALVVRIELLVAMCNTQSSDSALVHETFAWLDAHILLTLAVDALGGILADSSPALDALLARYSPAHHTALRAADMPNLAAELEQCNLFVGGIDTHKEDMFVDLFSKALPRRYDSKDLVSKMAEAMTRNAGFSAFLRVALAATQLGVYPHARSHAPFAVRRAVYRLCFFELDPALRQYAVGDFGSAAALRREFASTQIEERMRELIDADENAHVQVQCLSLMKSLAHAHSTALGAKRTKKPDAAADGTVRRSRKKPLHVAVVERTATTEGANQAPLTVAKHADTTPVCDGTGLLTRTALQFDDSEQADAVAAALAASHTVARLVYERNCGTDVFEQRRAAGLVPADAIGPPAKMWSPIEYDSAASGALAQPSDHVLPSEERLQADALIYEWLTTSVSSWPGRARVASARGKKTEYVFQSALLLAVREYIVFALRRWCEPLRYSFERLVHWYEWEQQVLRAANSLRTRLRQASFKTNWSTADLLADPRPYAVAAKKSPTHQFEPHVEPFIDALLQQFAQSSRGRNGKTVAATRPPVDTAPVDAVLPRETELLIRHALRFWKYARCLPLATELPIDPRDNSPNRAQPTDFMIDPVACDPRTACTRDVIVRDLVEQNRFPLSIFHATTDVLEQFAKCRVSYRDAPDGDERVAKIVEFVEWLAQTSIYQYQLIYAFCRAVNRHLQIKTFALPLHVREHQARALRNQNCMPPDAALPPHLLRGLVCRGCGRVATFLPPSEQRQAAIAFGNDEVRLLTTPSDDELVFAAVARRRCTPLAYEALVGADSWLTVLHHRARDAPPVYDRYCGPESAEVSGDAIDSPERVGLLPLDATEEQYEASVRARFQVDTRAGVTVPTDRRRAVAASDRPPQMVARGRGRLGEMAFSDALWLRVNERMMELGGCASGDRSFLLMGHMLPNNNRQFAPMRFACKTHNSRSETRKSRAAARASSLLNSAAAHDSDDELVDDGEPSVDAKALAARRSRLLIKECREAHAGAVYAACSRELMYEVDYLGRALCFTVLDSSKRVDCAPGDYVAICCDCLAATRSHDLLAIADRIVCTPCYNASRLRSGSVVQRTARGESIKTAATAVPNALSSDVLQTVQATARQLLFSPSYASLCNEVVLLGTVCAMDRCESVKTAETCFYGLEVLCDTDVGNEAFGFIYFCQTHARLYRALFNSPTRLPLSTVRYFMADSKRFSNNVGMHGNFLESVLRGDARSTDDRARQDLSKQLGAQHRDTMQERRKQRKVALNNGARRIAAQERAAVDRLLGSEPMAADD